MWNSGVRVIVLLIAMAVFSSGAKGQNVRGTNTPCSTNVDTQFACYLEGLYAWVNSFFTIDPNVDPTGFRCDQACNARLWPPPVNLDECEDCDEEDPD